MTPRSYITIAILVLLLSFQLVLLVILASFPYLPDPGFAALNSDVYMILEPVSTVILLGLLYAWLIRLGAKEARHHSRKFNKFLLFLAEPFRKLLSSIKTTTLQDAAESLKILSRPRLMLGVSLVVSTLLVLIPYRPDLNPSGVLVGVDSPDYVGWITGMLARPWPQAFQYSFVQGLDGSRPLLLVPLYLVAATGVSPTVIIQYLPVLLAPLLVLSSYTFVSYGHGRRELAGLVSLLTAVSFYTTVGLWGGYYANWLGLVIAFLFMTILLVFSRIPTRRSYVLLYVFSIALFLTHPWTWVLVLTVSLVFMITVWRETHNRVHIESIITIIATGVIIDIVKSLVFTTPTVASDIATKTPSIGTIAGFWHNLAQALLYTHGGLMANWLVLGLSVFAAFVLRFRNKFERLVLLWTAVPSIPFFVLDSYSQARIIYDLPIPVLAAVAIVTFLPQTRIRNIERTDLLIIVLMLLAMTNYAVQGILSI